MQKRLLFIVCLLLAIGQKMVAANELDLITISDFSISSGQSKEIGIELTNRDIYVGFQFDLQLPQGFTVDAYSANANRIPDGTSLRMSQQTDGSYRFVAAALDGSEITGNSGTVVNITVTAGQNLTEGSYTGYIRDIKLSRADGTGTIVSEEQPFTITVKGSEAYAALSDNGTVLTFYYDKLSEQRGGMAVGPFDIPGDRRWESNAEMVTTVVFDASFADYRPTSTAYWFYGFQNLTTITGMDYLITDNVTDMQYMFYNCSTLTSLDVTGFNTASVTNMSGMFYRCQQLQTLDLSNFNTARVTNMSWMFYSCYALTTIYAGSYWTTSSVTADEDGAMFTNCSNLVGSKGTAYSEDHTDKTYARIDGGTEAPGYLSDKNAATSYRIMIVVDGNGEVSYGQPDVVTGGNTVETTVDAGGMLELFFFPAEGYKLSQVLVDDTDVTAQVTTVNNGGSSYILNNIYDSHKITVTFASLSKVEKPTYSWDRDQLILTTATEGASIYYTNSADAASGAEGTATPGGGNGTLYEGPITIAADALITAWAVKDEMINSDTLIIDYPYTAWQELLSAVGTGQTVLRNAERSTRVSGDMKNRLSSLIGEAQNMYGERTETENVILEKARKIYELAEEMQRIIDQVEEAYAALSENNTVLTFYYDYDKSTRNGMDIGPFSGYQEMGWSGMKGSITAVKFDSSFAEYHPTSTAYWFDGLYVLTTIDGIENLNTDNVTDMRQMFDACSSLTSIDLSHFNTEQVTNMDNMFWGMSNLASLDLTSFNTAQVTSMSYMFASSSRLQTIIVGSGWSNAGVGEQSMFEGCSALVGGRGTSYDADHVDATYARIDKAPTAPGYLTGETREIAVMAVAGANGHFTADTYDANGNGYGERTTVAAGSEATIWVYEGGQIRFQLFPDDTYQIGTVTVNGTDMTAKIIDRDIFDLNSITTAQTIEVTFTSLAKVDTPTPSWSGDQLTLTTATEGATIYYTNSAGATGETLYEGPITIAADALITAWAVKEGMQNSDTLIIDYPYTAWQELLMAANAGEETVAQATGSEKVEQQLVQQLSHMVVEARMFYEERLWEEQSIRHMTEEIRNLTDVINAQLNAITEKAEKPTFAWTGDVLTLTSATENAAIYYTMNDGEAILYQEGITVTADAVITAWATRNDRLNSDTLVIDYPYTLWSRLVTATKDATTTANIAANSSKVYPQMVQRLREMLREAEEMYSERTAERSRIEWMIDELSMMIAEINVQLSSAEFSFDGQTLTVSGETTLSAAVEAAGGRAHVSESVTAIFWETTATINADSLRAVNITNPNLLLYVNTASQAPADVQNVIVGDVASRIVLTDVEGEQNGNFNCPRPFVAQRITYTRNFKQRTQVGVSRGWETLALPFDVQVIYKEDGTELVPFAANSKDDRTRPFWLKQVAGEELADAAAIEAYRPYLLSLPNDPSVYPADYCLSGNVRFISENVTIADTYETEGNLGNARLMTTFSKVETSDEVYALNVSQELENHAEGSIFEAGLRDVRPFECYTIHTNNDGPAPAFMTVADLLNGGLTGITPAVSGLPANDTEAWYTLDGRKLQERPTAKGLYIHQNRKVVVK